MAKTHTAKKAPKEYRQRKQILQTNSRNRRRSVKKEGAVKAGDFKITPEVAYGDINAIYFHSYARNFHEAIGELQLVKSFTDMFTSTIHVLGATLNELMKQQEAYDNIAELKKAKFRLPDGREVGLLEYYSYQGPYQKALASLKRFSNIGKMATRGNVVYQAGSEFVYSFYLDGYAKFEKAPITARGIEGREKIKKLYIHDFIKQGWPDAIASDIAEAMLAAAEYNAKNSKLTVEQRTKRKSVPKEMLDILTKYGSSTDTPLTVLQKLNTILSPSNATRNKHSINLTTALNDLSTLAQMIERSQFDIPAGFLLEDIGSLEGKGTGRKISRLTTTDNVLKVTEAISSNAAVLDKQIGSSFKFYTSNRLGLQSALTHADLLAWLGSDKIKQFYYFLFNYEMLSDAELTGKRDASDNHVINGDVLDILSYMERFIYKLMFCSTIMAPFIANRFDQPVSPKLSMETVPTLKKDTEHILPVLLHVNGRTVFIWDIYKELFNLLHDEVQIDLEFHVHPDKRSYAGLVTRKSKISEITSYTDITDNSLVTDSLTKLTRSATKSPELVTSRIWIDMAKIMNKQGGQ